MEQQIRKGAYPNVQTFCYMYDVQPRTVYQDLQMLRQMIGLAIVFDRARNGYYIQNPERKLPSFELTDDELIALSFSKELLSTYTRKTFAPLLEGALDKVTDRNKRKSSLNLNELGSFLRLLDANGEAPPRRVFIELFRAWSERCITTITYSMNTRETSVTVEMLPCCLVLKLGSWYLVAFCLTANSLRVLPAETISSIRTSSRRQSFADSAELNRFVDLFFSSASQSSDFPD